MKKSHCAESEIISSHGEGKMIVAKSELCQKYGANYGANKASNITGIVYGRGAALVTQIHLSATEVKVSY